MTKDKILNFWQNLLGYGLLGLVIGIVYSIIDSSTPVGAKIIWVSLTICLYSMGMYKLKSLENEEQSNDKE